MYYRRAQILAKNAGNNCATQPTARQLNVNELKKISSTNNNIIYHGGMEWKIPKIRCSSYSEAITTKVGSIERQDKEAYTVAIYKELHWNFLLFNMIRCTESRIFYPFRIRFDRCDVGVKYGIANQFRSNSLIHKSKLISCANAYLIWYPYIDQKTTIFDHLGFVRPIYSQEKILHTRRP